MNEHHFNPNDHLLQLKTRDGYKDYLPVQWRLVWFREQCPQGTIETEEVLVDLDREVEEEAYVWNNERRRSEKVVKHGRGYARFRAIVTDGKGGRATGTKSENAASFPDYIEKAETGAIGRALAALGYGTQFSPELDEAHRLADSPVEPQRQSAASNTAAVGNQTQQENAATPPSATEQQLASIRKLCEHVGKHVPEEVASLSFVGAKKMIQQLTAEYRESREANKNTAPPAEGQISPKSRAGDLYSQMSSKAIITGRTADAIKREFWRCSTQVCGHAIQSLADFTANDITKLEQFVAAAIQEQEQQQRQVAR